MNQRPPDDAIANRVRRCSKCGGEMRCAHQTEFRVNGNYSGRQYRFDCQGCGKSLTELNAARIATAGTMVVGGCLLGGMLVYFGLDMLVSTLLHGSRGNSLGATILVLVLFLGLGIPFLLGMLWAVRWFVTNSLELRRNPIVR